MVRTGESEEGVFRAFIVERGLKVSDGGDVAPIAYRS